jgi:hypothetical protein
VLRFEVITLSEHIVNENKQIAGSYQCPHAGNHIKSSRQTVQKRVLSFPYSVIAVVFTRLFPTEHESPQSIMIAPLKDRFPSGET